MTQSDYDKIMHIGKYGTLDEKDTNPADSQFCKPPLGCKPWYVVYEGRIRELSEAIARYADKPDDHCVYDWLQEIFLLRQFVQLIRKHMKRKEFYDDEIDE